MRFQLDSSWQRHGRAVVAGSPLRLFRLTAAGGRVAEAIERGDEVAASGLVDRLLGAGAIHPVHALVEDPDCARPMPVAHRFDVDDVTVVTPQLGGTLVADDRITVDDGSDPPIEGATVRLPVNRGPAAARNAARPYVATPLVAFVDADVELLDDVGVRCWLKHLLPHFDDPQVGLVAPRIAGEADSPLDLGTEPARIRAGTRVSYVPGAALVVRVEALDAIGWFDEGLRYGEDVDLVWRLDEAGWRCRYEPKSVVWHEPRATLAGKLRQHAAYGTSAAPLALRHPGAMSPVRTNGWTAAAWGIGIGVHPALGAGIALGSSAALVPKLPDVPPPTAVGLALRGHVLAARQYGAALRRVWWPLLAIAALVSRRARFVALGAIALDPRAVPTDLAYGCGLWRGMRTHRTWAPIVPRLSAWPGRASAPSPDRRVAAPADRPADR